MEKLLITGVNGLLGQKLLDQAQSKYHVVGVDLHEQAFNKKAKFQYVRLDLTKRRAVRDLILDHYPDCIINAAAMTDVDGCEKQKEKCWNSNVMAVENLIYGARKTGSKIVQLSTDYIFDGKSGPYDESAVPSPQGYYGKSKLASENLLVASQLDHAIVRTMVLYGDGINVRPNFVTWLLDKLRNKQPVTIVTDQIGNPTLADELAAAILALVERKKWDVYHISGSEAMDRFSFAKKVAEVFKLDQSLITPITTAELKQAAPRPLQSGFIIDKARSELGIEMSNVEEGLKKFKRQYKKFILF